MSETDQVQAESAAGAALAVGSQEGAAVSTGAVQGRRWVAYLSLARWRRRLKRQRAKFRIARSGLFDADWYAKSYPETVAAGPLNHYVDHGFAEGRRPNPLFDPAWYLQDNEDVRESGADPLLHYIGAGEREGRRPNPLFDPAWYRAEYEDVARSRQSPLRHYLAHGAAEGRAASAAFDGKLYLESNPDLQGIADPLAHYLHVGRARNRPTGRSAHGPGFFFRPSDDPAGQGRYHIAPRGDDGYCYLPPRHPADLVQRLAALTPRTRFSIVTPVYNVDPVYLEKLIRSVEAQWWRDWELILVDDASPRAETRRYLENLRDSSLPDPRFRITLRAKNGGIAEATNSALDMATGDYVVFLDHDDELTEDCLYALAERIAVTDADFIYSDEDKIDEAGAFFMPFFKPDWSPDAFMSIMYTCHVSCVRRSLLREVGGVRTGFDGAQDYDLIFRVTEKAKRIEHIPRVLYHWRTLPTSTASDINAKPAAIGAAARAKADALKRRGLEGAVDPVEGMPGQFRVNYRPDPAHKVSIIIPSKNNFTVLKACIDSIRAKTTFPNYEIVIIDNGSRNADVLDYLGGLSASGAAVVLADDRPFNFSALNNLGVKRATGDYLLFLNDDTEVIAPDWLSRMLGYAQLPHVGAVGAKLLYPDGTTQHCGVVNIGEGPHHAFLGAESDVPRYFGRNIMEANWIAVTGACLMVSRERFDQVGGFDETFPVAYNDIDLCFRLLDAGFYNVVCQQAKLTHHESLSRGSDADPERQKRLRIDWRRLYAKHPEFYLSDPFFNPNLDRHDFQFAMYAV